MLKRICLLLLCVFVERASFAITETINWYVGDSVYDSTTCESGDDVILPNNPTAPRGYYFAGWVRYTPIEYLESTGTQYIDTNYGIRDLLTIRAVAELSFTNTAVYRVLLFGGKSYKFFFGINPQNKVEYQAGGSVTNTNVLVSMNTKYLFDMNVPASTFIVQEVGGDTIVQLNSIVKQSYVINTSGTLFGYKETAEVKRVPMTIYSFKLYDNDTLVRDMIPVLDENGVACMYDRITDAFFYNAGTGNFTAGPVISGQ